MPLLPEWMLRYQDRMAVHDFTSQRLFVEAPLSAGACVPCDSAQANYLLNVLRLTAGDSILVFNGRDGEWRASVSPSGKRGAVLEIGERTRAQEGGPDIHYLFAPLKRARLDYMVQKATEMGVARLVPVLTRRTVAERVNLDRLRANAIEAAEQCGILRVPEITEPQKLEHALKGWDASRRLSFATRARQSRTPSPRCGRHWVRRSPCPPLPCSSAPKAASNQPSASCYLRQPFILAISLGPRIMRADTAAVAALALVNAAIGDWR